MSAITDNKFFKPNQSTFKNKAEFKQLVIRKEVKELFQSFYNFSNKAELRFVGGCVRKLINNEKVDDIDMSTNLKPDEVIKVFKQNKINFHETGINHGTVTAVINDSIFEITSLRKDIKTDGRHAQVEYTEKWLEDAARRDFTINAIYSDIEGRIFDPFNGISDLQNGNIKFIGSPEDRIQEDYLRILRYFRFFTKYSKAEHDDNVIKSIKRYINGLNKISNERIFDELKKILTLENIYNLFSQKQSKEIIINIFPQFKYSDRLKEIDTLNNKLKNLYDHHIILALLILDETNDHEYFCHKFKTSNKIKNRFKNISINFNNLKNNKFFSKKNIKKLIYLSSKNEVIDLLLFSKCANTKLKNSNIEELIDYVNICNVPKFPISGDYLKEHGYETGKILGKKLKLLEEKWIENDFVIDKKVVEKSLGKASKN